MNMPIFRILCSIYGAIYKMKRVTYEIGKSKPPQTVPSCIESFRESDTRGEDPIEFICIPYMLSCFYFTHRNNHGS